VKTARVKLSADSNLSQPNGTKRIGILPSLWWKIPARI